MKGVVPALPDGQRLWNKFLHFDTMIASTMEDQCRKPGIGLVRTHQRRPVSEVVSPILGGWGL